MRVRDVMTASPACASPDDPLEVVARLMIRFDCGSIPICEGIGVKRVVGIVTDRDVVVRAVAAGKCPLTLSARDVMSHPIAVVPADADLATAIQILETNQVRRLPVVNEQGALVGMIAQADVVRNILPAQAGGFVQHVSQTLF